MTQLLNYLREQTQDIHKELDQSLCSRSIMDGSISREFYVEFLEKNYTAYAIVENALLSANGQLAPSLEKFITTEKSKKLSQDIIAATGHQPMLPHKEEKYTLNSDIEAIGALYVIEGSMMGNSVISKKLGECKSLDSLPPSIFYSVNNRKLETWILFKKEIEKLSFSQKDLDAAARTAIKTFRLFS